VNAAATPSLEDYPLYVHVGFSGSRQLFDASAHPTVDATAFEAALVPLLAAAIRRACAELQVAPQHALCGISQVAIGGDFAFTGACQQLNAVQCIYLPQPLDEYLAAVGSGGQRDFTNDQEQRARELVKGSHIICTRVVSVANRRDERFEEVNLEIVDDSDFMVCLLGHDAGKPGGAASMRQIGRSRGKPVLVLQVDVEPNGAPKIAQYELQGASDFSGEFKASPATTAAQSIEQIKDDQSLRAKAGRKRFLLGAAAVIFTHLGATALAVLALVLHDMHVAWLLAALLFSELVLLGWGLWSHWKLHRSHAAPSWAEARLIAEAARSAAAVGALPIPLVQLKTLPFPAHRRHLLRSLNTQHLREAKAAAPPTTGTFYVDARFKGKGDQLKYYRDSADRAQRTSKWIVRPIFYSASLAAFVATALKLAMNWPGLDLHALWPALSALEARHDTVTTWIGFAAVVLPLIAAAALSGAAAYDLEARASTYRDMATFLQEQKKRLHAAATQPELARLVLETEYRLLGETVSWFARRRFAEVA